MSQPVLFVVRKEMNIVRPFSVKVNLTPEVIEVTYVRRHMINGQIHDFFIGGSRLDMEKLRKRVDWKDCTQYGLHLKSYDIQSMHFLCNLVDSMVEQGMDPNEIPDALEQAVPRYGTVNRNGYLFNISAQLQNGRVTSLEGHGLIAAFRMLNFTIKFKDSTFDKIMVSMNIDPACHLEVNEGVKVKTVINSMEIYQHLRRQSDAIRELVWRPKLKITSLDKDQLQLMGKLEALYTTEQIKSEFYEAAKQAITDGTGMLVDSKEPGRVTMQMQLVKEWTGEAVEHTAEVYLENVNGYLPKNRIYLNEHGYGELYAMPLGLEPGETMRIKAGFRYQTGIEDFTLYVV